MAGYSRILLRNLFPSMLRDILCLNKNNITYIIDYITQPFSALLYLLIVNFLSLFGKQVWDGGIFL